MDDSTSNAAAPLMRRTDVPLNLLHHTNGHLPGRKQRQGQIGMSNRFLPSGDSFGGSDMGGSSIAGGSVHGGDATQHLGKRAASSMSQTRLSDFFSRSRDGSGDRAISSDGVAVRRSATPSAFFYGSSVVGNQAPPMDTRKTPSIYTNASAELSSAMEGSTQRKGSRGSSNQHHPPGVPTAQQTLSMIARNNHDTSAAKSGHSKTPVIGIAGQIPAADGSSYNSLPHNREVECEVPMKHSVPAELRSSLNHGGRTASVTPNFLQRSVPSSEERAGRGNELMKFFRSKSGLDDRGKGSTSTLPNLEANQPNGRVQRTVYPHTKSTVQPPANSGAYMPASHQFNPNDRGLGSTNPAQELKLAGRVVKDMKADLRRSNEQRVLANCTAYDQRLERKKESRILYKAEMMRQQKRMLEETEKRFRKGKDDGPQLPIDR